MLLRINQLSWVAWVEIRSWSGFLGELYPNSYEMQIRFKKHVDSNIFMLILLIQLYNMILLHTRRGHLTLQGLFRRRLEHLRLLPGGLQCGRPRREPGEAGQQRPPLGRLAAGLPLLPHRAHHPAREAGAGALPDHARVARPKTCALFFRV